MEYKNEQLEAIYHEEGKISLTPSGYQNEYYLKDHLGNIRVVFADKNQDGEIDLTNELLQENHFYPFGMQMDGFSQNYATTGATNRYNYNGKELNGDLGLDMHDYGARWYGASIGRWNAIDPLAEKYTTISPYVYVANNPMIFVNPDGRVIMGSNGKPISYSISEDNTIEWSSNATKDTKTIGNALFLTPSGTEALNNLMNLDTEVQLELTDKETVGQGVTHVLDENGNVVGPEQQHDDKHRNEKGEFNSIRITISTYTADDDSKSRFANTSEDEIINAVGTHEEMHTRPSEIERDKKLGTDGAHKPKFEKELKTRLEFSTLHPTIAKKPTRYLNNYKKGAKININKIIKNNQ